MSQTTSPPAEHWLRQPDAEAAFAPSEGFWCTAFRVRVDGVWRPILAEPPSWEALRTRPTFYGNPLLFPFPISVAGGRFRYRGREHVVPPSREGRPIHGLVRDQPWRLDRLWQDGAGAHVQATIETAGQPDRLRLFPFPFRLRATYSLSGTTLGLAVEATNLGDEPMPFGLGIHPYLPIEPGDRRVVRADGERVARFGPDQASVALEPVPPEVDLRAGRRLADLIGINHAGSAASIFVHYADLDRGGFGWTLEGRPTVRISTSPDFRTMVHFAPAEPTVVSPVIATCLSNAFNLHAVGQAAGMLELEPGQQWRGWARIAVAL